jgi:hypothetical protein
VRKLSIPRRSSIVLVFAAMLATMGCTRASSPTTRTRAIKPTLSTHPYARNKPVEAELPMSTFLPIESW